MFISRILVQIKLQENIIESGEGGRRIELFWIYYLTAGDQEKDAHQSIWVVRNLSMSRYQCSVRYKSRVFVILMFHLKLL